MLTTIDVELYSRALHLIYHAMSPTQKYWHTEVGYNYRMTNLQAALGFAQTKRIDSFLKKKQAIFDQYQYDLSRYSGLKLNRTAAGYQNVFWQICLEVDNWTARERDQFMQSLAECGVESRPYFYPLSDMPMYRDGCVHPTPISHQVSQQGLNLPSYFDMSHQDVTDVCLAVKDCLSLSKFVCN